MSYIYDNVAKNVFAFEIISRRDCQRIDLNRTRKVIYHARIQRETLCKKIFWLQIELKA